MSTKIGTAANYLDLIDQLDSFLTATGHAWGKSFDGAGNGDVTNYLGTASSVAETFTLTATSATNFTVVGSVSGALAAATVGTPYTSAKIAFTITAGSTPFSVGDKFYLSTSPKWTRLRAEGSADSLKRSTNFTNLEAVVDPLLEDTAVGARAATNGFIEWEMHRPTEVARFTVRCDDNNLAPKAFTLQYRDTTGDAWVDAVSFTAQSFAESRVTKEYAVPAAGARKYWRLSITESSGASLSLRHVRLFPKTGDSYSLAARAEFAWQAPGLDGAKQINVGLLTYGSGTADVFNAGFVGLRAFDTHKAIDAQPNGTGAKWLSLINSPMGFWFVVNGQRLIVVTKFASLYQVAYAGFGLPYEPPSVHAYPSIVAASHVIRTQRYDSTRADYRSPADPGSSALAAFYPDAAWRLHQNRWYNGNNNAEGSADSQGYCVWPSRFYSQNDGGPTFVRDNLDGTRPLMPNVLFALTANNSFRHVWGEFDGYYWTTGFGTVAEALIREAGFDHLVVNNVFRNTPKDFAAVRLD